MEKVCIQCKKIKEFRWFRKTRGGENNKNYYKDICKECDACNRGDKKLKQISYDLPNIERAYIAGLFDGEGCIGLYKRGRKSKSRRGSQGTSYNLRVQITSTDFIIIEWLISRFKGLHYCSTWDNSKNDDSNRNVNIWKDTHQFVLVSRNAEGFLKCILPYLIIKKERAILGIEYMATMAYNGMDLPDKLIEQRNKIFNTLKLLNKRGKSEI